MTLPNSTTSWKQYIQELVRTSEPRWSEHNIDVGVRRIPLVSEEEIVAVTELALGLVLIELLGQLGE